MRQNRGFKFISISTVWFWLIVCALLPNLALFLVSFLDRSDLSFYVPLLTLDNYRRLFDPQFVGILVKSLFIAGVSTFTCLLVGYPFAYFLARSSRRLRPWLMLLVIIPFWTNSLVRTYAIYTILQNRGLLNKVLNWLGVVEGNFSLMYTDFSVFLGLTYTLLPFMILPLYASIEKLDLRLLDAAKDLGAGPVKSFIHITLPLTLPGIAAGSILVFLPALSLFYVPEILGGIDYRLLGSYIQFNFGKGGDWPLGAAASSVLTILLIILALFYRFANKRTATEGAAPVPGVKKKPGKKRSRGAVAPTEAPHA